MEAILNEAEINDRTKVYLTALVDYDFPDVDYTHNEVFLAIDDVAYWFTRVVADEGPPFFNALVSALRGEVSCLTT